MTDPSRSPSLHSDLVMLPGHSYVLLSPAALGIVNYSTAAAGQALAASSQQVMDNLQRARTERLNRESTARLAKQKADKAVGDAQSSQNAAVAALTDAQHKFITGHQ